jgi:hypothetical protein
LFFGSDIGEYLITTLHVLFSCDFLVLRTVDLLKCQIVNTPYDHG